jgi:hypothetical protein
MLLGCWFTMPPGSSLEKPPGCWLCEVAWLLAVQIRVAAYSVKLPGWRLRKAVQLRDLRSHAAGDCEAARLLGLRSRPAAGFTKPPGC